jgi:hypothetical protein
LDVGRAQPDRECELVRRVLDAQQESRIRGQAEPTGERPRELPRLVVAAFREPRGGQRHGDDAVGSRQAARAPGGREELRQRHAQIERRMELEGRDETVPRMCVVESGQRGIAGRRMCHACAADGNPVGHAQCAAAATPDPPGVAIAARAAHALAGPAATQRALRRQRWHVREQASKRHGSIYCPPMAAHDDSTAPRPWADAAVERALRRLARRPEPPWLHAEVARRMAERLVIVKLQPARIVDWWSSLGAGTTLLRESYPKAQIVAVEPDAAWLQKRRKPSVRRGGPPLRRRGIEVVRDGDDLGAPAQLVWANMMLHAVQDPPALMARWQRAAGGRRLPDVLVLRARHAARAA